MAEENQGKQAKTPGSAPAAKAEAAESEHYEEVAEYRIGEGPPPIALIVAFLLIVAWALFSWMPLFSVVKNAGY